MAVDTVRARGVVEVCRAAGDAEPTRNILQEHPRGYAVYARAAAAAGAAIAGWRAAAVAGAVPGVFEVGVVAGAQAGFVELQEESVLAAEALYGAVVESLAGGAVQRRVADLAAPHARVLGIAEGTRRHTHATEQVPICRGIGALGAVLRKAAIALQAGHVALLAEPARLVLVVGRRTARPASLILYKFISPVGAEVAVAQVGSRATCAVTRVVYQVARAGGHALFIGDVV